MPWPDHSELTFGFSFLREFEKQYTPAGRFPKAPDFISQYDEAMKGYDVEAALDKSTPVFFQFKRSFVIKSPLASEIQCGDFSGPILYRMYLRKKNNYQQHRALQQLEERRTRFFSDSQIETHQDLTQAYSAGTVVSDAAALSRLMKLSFQMIVMSTGCALVPVTIGQISIPAKGIALSVSIMRGILF